MKSKSTYFIVLFCSLTILSWLILTEAHPVDSKTAGSLSESFGFSSNESPKDETNFEKKESPSRPKRTIGFLRQLFPGLSQIIDRKIQYITRILFRVVGRLILRGGVAGGGGNSGSGGDGGSGRKVSITLPTFPPDEEEETEVPTEKQSSSSESSSQGIDIRFGGEDQSSAASDQSNSTSTTSKANADASSSSSIAPSESDSATDAQESNTIVRKVRDTSDSETTLSFDEELSSTESSMKRQGLLWRLSEMRKKRGSFGSANGSGNFLLDLVRLIAGSGITPEKDEELNAPRDERDDNSVDGNEVNHSSSNDYSEDQYNAGIPGPLTRLFILANRGISSLIQDIIIRLAQTSERIVNYKARLITAII